MIPKVGPSTVAALVAILTVLSAFVSTWVEGNPSPALASVAAALTAALGVLRSWQSVSADKGTDTSKDASQSQ